jgi:adenylate cyclase
MRFLPDIRYGTGRYPEKIARRLRLVNATAWIIAAVTLGFAIVQLADATPGVWPAGLANALTAAACAAAPLLHRWSPLLAPAALVGAGLAAIAGVSLVFGTNSGMTFYALLVPALIVPFFGLDRIPPAAALALLSAIVVVALHHFVPGNTGVVPPDRLFFGNFVFSVVGSFAILFLIVLYAVRQIARAEAAAEREQARSENLLANILPPAVGRRLKEGGGEIADSYPEASVLFADMAGFTARAADTPPADLVRFLNEVFTRLDALVERHGLEKIKTTGDSYMVVSGVPAPRADHAEALAALALDMRAALAGLVDPKGRPVPVRIGMASGPVVAGVVGTKKFFYDVWGDTVNLAARMEQTGEPGRIQVAPATREKLSKDFVLAERGTIEVRGKGPMRTWFLEGRR